MPACDVYTPVMPADSFVLNTVIIDSIAADTLEGRFPKFITAEEADSLHSQATADSIAAAQAAILEIPSGSEAGIAPSPLAQSAGNSTPLNAIMMGTLIIAGLASGGLIRALKSYRHDLLGIRRRPNVFDDDNSASFPMALVLAIVYIVFGGVILCSITGPAAGISFAGAAASMAVLAVYYLFRLTAYQTVGYTFASGEGRRQWVDGFLASEAFCGLLLIVPAFLTVNRPDWQMPLLIISLSICAIARLLFLIKGFRIFYVNFRSLLYFILYLCTLEIIPVLAVYQFGIYLQAITV